MIGDFLFIKIKNFNFKVFIIYYIIKDINIDSIFEIYEKVLIKSMVEERDDFICNKSFI